MTVVLGLVAATSLRVLANATAATKITLNLRDVEFKKVLTVIESQSDYRFMFSNRNIPSDSKVDINVKDAQITTVMDLILNNSGYTYQELSNNLIVIMPKGAQLKAIKVIGKVLDQTGEALIGASVKIKGTSDGVATDENGAFTISVPDDAVLLVSYVGFKTQEIPVNGKTAITITLQPNDRIMNEVVVTALGIKREQKALGYAVSTITSEQITAAGATNFASALYGKAAGVKITTAPGGATSAVNIQIRGVNSLNYNTQPLYVVDGVQIRNNNEKGAAGTNNADYWADNRIRGNGILDINPADIENLTVLKGASATALYGSDAASGVVVITTKKGMKGRGLGVDLNYSNTAERIAFAPEYQNVYGPGYDRTSAGANANAAGWVPIGNDGTVRPYFRAYGQFGPKMEGQLVPWWDGSMHPYSPQPNNYNQLFQKGYNSNLNVSLSNMTEKANYRFSYTRNDYKGVQIGGDQQRNTFNLNSTIKLHNKVSLDVVGGYVNTKITNRPMQMARIFNNFGGFFSRAEDMAVVFDKYKTTKGYKFVPWDQVQLNPDEALKYNIRATDLLDFLWQQLRNQEIEKQDRLLSSVTLNVDLAKGLRYRTRVGNDFTSINTENKQFNEKPIAFNTGSSTGGYTVSKGRYSIVYSDQLLTYARDEESRVFGYSVSAGFQTRKETYSDQRSATNGGLVTANWFSINNSYNIQNTSEQRSGSFKYAYLGIMNLSYMNYLFLEGTARQESSSTLPHGNNTYFYPSVNTSFIFTEAFHLPTIINYGKVRASYGLVGNAPPPFESNVTYTQKPISTVTGSVPLLVAQSNYGNEGLRPERKKEFEFGTEVKMLNSRIGFDISYYNSKVTDLLMRLNVAVSNGAKTRITNVGELQSHGIEVALTATPIKNKLVWNTRLNFANSVSTINQLTEGVDQIVMLYAARNGLKVVAEKGQPIGNIYMFPRKTDDKGNFVITANGLYDVDITKYQKMGNLLPTIVGGFANTISYHNLTLDFMIDYRFGGKIVSTPIKYQTSAGMYKSTLWGRDEENGGLPYYLNAAGEMVQLPSHNSIPPNGPIYHDGIILDGVTANGEKNTKMVQAGYYYINQFGDAVSAWNEPAIQKNDYAKLREVVLGYNISKTAAAKLRLQSLRMSLIGRNLFYVYRTLKNIDPEAPMGSSWLKQGIDEGSSGATRSYGFSINASF
ncbi:SusC/RagA family TonB-linked outer membrane protein [Chitinophaga sp. B61]|uniref:SusC/RagA family TonB-linked outer membrane protein n=2 Tax=Chitinophaga rhizophila TaxID=2866212 RepID=A0ABS7GJY6_9BACT|nr:SusC/RagA family TonB-linked outer membrane protein [Chitinophaga rhizophila]